MLLVIFQLQERINILLRTSAQYHKHRREEEMRVLTIQPPPIYYGKNCPGQRRNGKFLQGYRTKKNTNGQLHCQIDVNMKSSISTFGFEHQLNLLIYKDKTQTEKKSRNTQTVYQFFISRMCQDRTPLPNIKTKWQWPNKPVFVCVMISLFMKFIYDQSIWQ